MSPARRRTPSLAAPRCGCCATGRRPNIKASRNSFHSFRSRRCRRPGIRTPAICRSPARPSISAARRVSQVSATGTNLVLALDGQLILKIFPPMLRAQFVSERASLAQLAGRLGVPIPDIVAEGERDGWPYLVITRLAGVLGSDAWPDMAEA